MASILPDGQGFVAVPSDTWLLPSKVKVAAAQIVGLTPTVVGALAKPATPTSTQMVVLNADGTVATQAIPTGGGTTTDGLTLIAARLATL